MSVSDFQPVIGLEVHAQLLTHSKVFSSASTQFGAIPNLNTQPLCIGLPGSLPVLNARVVDMAIAAGVALQCTVNEVSIWSRKHYFYPDLPKGYQITQFEKPICEWGKIEIGESSVKKEIRVRRIHIEEDAGKSIHDAQERASLVDLNRAGTPLIEIVSEPDLRTADEAVEYLKSLRDILVYIGVNDGNLEEGSFRCDANVSVMKKGSTQFGTRAELKNINSFRFIKQAIEYEIERQVDLIESGGTVVQETRLFDSQRNETRAMRSKEEAHDYRYFPEPDLPPLVVSKEKIEHIAKTLPELPKVKFQRFLQEYKLSEYDVTQLMNERAFADFFEACAKGYKEPKKVANWLLGEFLRLHKEEVLAFDKIRFTPGQLQRLLTLVDNGDISNNAAKTVFEEMFKSGAAPDDVVKAKGLIQVNDSALIEAAVDEVLRANAADVEKYRSGKKALLGFFVGQVMKTMKGKANPAVVSRLVTQKLEGP